MVIFLITGHEFKMVNSEKVLILHLNYDSEFGIDFRTHHKNSTMKNEIKKYIQKHNIHFDGEKIALSFGGVILAVLLCFQTPNSSSDFKLTYVGDSILPNVIEVEKDGFTKEEISIQENIEDNSNSSTTDTTTKQNSSGTIFSNSNSVSSNNSSKKESVEEKQISSGKTVTVYRSNGSAINLDLEEYLIGVVASEMPASFHSEALKAQAVVARTYALKKIADGQKLTDTNSTQAYKDNNELKKEWGSNFDAYYQKVKDAVLSTQGLSIYYQGNYIDAVYHSTSNGKTEDAVYVWGNSVPYLKSVDSSWDQEAASYLREVSKDFSNVLQLLGLPIQEDISLEILSRDSSGRVLEVEVGNQTFTGVEFRNLLGLRSSDFDFTIENGNVIITTRGYGHGVGLSQYGTNGMAKAGYSFRDILKHYYTGVEIY